MQSFKELLTQLTRSGLSQIYFSGEQLSDSELETLISAMEVSPLLVEFVDLSNNEITSTGAIAFAEFVKKTPSLKEVNLHGNKIDDTGAAAFFPIFRNSVHPSSFDLSGNPCSDIFVKRLALLAKNASLPEAIRLSLLKGKAEVLDLSGIHFNKIDQRLLTFFLEDVGGVDSLILSGCATGDAGVVMIGSMIKNSRVKNIDLSNNDISDTGLSQFVQRADLPHHPTLKTLSFKQNIRIGNYGVQQLTKVLFEENDVITAFDVSETSVTTNFRSIIDHECELNKEPLPLKKAVVAIRSNNESCKVVNLQWEKNMQNAARFISSPLQYNTVLEELNLGDCHLGDSGIDILSEALVKNKTLRVLALPNNNITSHGAKILFQRLQQHESLEDVNVASNKIDDEAANVIVNTLRLNALIKNLNIVNNFVSANYVNEIEGLILLNQAPKSIRILVVEIEQNYSSLTSVCLSGNSGEGYCNDSSVRLLSQALVMNKTVTDLDLSNSVVGDIGVFSLAEMLMTNATVKLLNLEANSITDKGAKRLSDALRVNASLQQLNLSNNAITNAGVSDYVEMLRFNDSLLHVCLDKTGVSANVYAKIVEAADLNKESKGVKDTLYRLRDGDKSLVRIDLRRSKCSRSLDNQSMSTLAVQLRGVPWVQELLLSGNDIGAEGCAHIANILSQGCCGIRFIDLSCNPIDDRGLGELSRGLLSENCVLEALNLTGTEVTTAGIEKFNEVLKVNSSLQEMLVPERVSSTVFCKMNRELLVNAQPKSLKPLLKSLDANEIVSHVVFRDPNHQFSDSACKLLCMSLINNSHVVSVDMSHNALTQECVPFVVEALMRSQGIKHVDLSHNNIDEAGGEALVECLCQNNTVISFSLEGNPVSHNVINKMNELLHLNGGSIALKKILLKHRSGVLTEEVIDLNAQNTSYKLTDEDVRLLCEVLADSTTIRAVDLGRNMITDNGCEMLADVLRVNTKVEALYLDYNPIAEIGGEALYNTLKVNHQLHTLFLQGTSVPEEIWEEILSLLHVNETPMRERIDMRNSQLQDINDEVQFKNTDYAISQEKKVNEEALAPYMSLNKNALLR
ncbi:putative Leucine Rich repeat [Trypanosoma vivax]|uniref:Paraflagellar rod component n=1 Tax=Trypanosoma vivax (strain Y486) TaxID=1055687 RepID=G0U7N8_TRYVY|nr:hypothetical protein TRVL_08744 [Trypanosoma vivax]KAH8620419.1 putative Leucine Rich repeat [Trypanosoma vivax]CCC51896.1 conserved hypothetical protein [Trypanosoma vivax Y486]